MATIYWTPLLFKVGNWQCTGKINRAMGKNSLRMVLYHVLMKHSISIRLMCKKKSLFISDVHNNYGSQKIWTLVEWKKNNILYYYSIWIKSFYLCINSAVCGVQSTESKSYQCCIYNEMLYRSLGKIVSPEITNNNDLLIKAQGYVLLH